MSDTESAWAAGFFDGEGTTCLIGRSIIMGIQQNQREPLERLNLALGEQGTIYGPYAYKDGRKPRYELRLNGLTRVRYALDIMWPYLCEPKRQQATLAITRFESVPRERPMRTQNLREVPLRATP